MKLKRRPSTFDSANQHADRGRLCVTMDRQNCQAAKTAIERREYFDKAVGTPDQAEHATGFQSSSCRVNPALERRSRRNVSDLPRFVR